jgi:hypothetical protein
MDELYDASPGDLHQPRDLLSRALSAERFEAELVQLGFLHDIAHLLTALLLYRGRLPQGSPASNAALNLYFFRTDEEIRQAAAKFGGRYTRYTDDLVISVAETSSIAQAVALLEQSIADLGFAVNAAKIERVRLLHEERTVNGVAINSPKWTRLPAKESQSLVNKCNQFVIAAKSVSPDTLIGLSIRRRRLEGCKNYCSMAGHSPAAALNRLLAFADASISQRLTNDGIRVISRWWQKNQHRDEAEILAARWFEQRRLPVNTDKVTIGPQ